MAGGPTFEMRPTIIFELAVAGGASVIVTKNGRDFRGAELQFPGLRVLTPGDLLKEI